MMHEHYMDRCLQLAEMGRGRVSPNPLVGCVIVHNDLIIGEGFHKEYGGPHAEVNAINDVKDQSLLNHSTLYVSLEPCSHHGKTPPCADLIIQKKIPRVVICNVDPNPLVGGQGINRLIEHGIEIEVGVQEKKGIWLNRVFIKAMKERLPYITLKWAVTSDGFIGRPPGSVKSAHITNQYSDKLVHKMRSEYDAILIGSGTLKSDNPLLTNRLWAGGKGPVRVVIGSDIDIDQYKVAITPPKTIVIKSNKNLIPILTDLVNRGIQSLIVEGGPTILKSFIQNDLWDEIVTIESRSVWNEGINAPEAPGKPDFSKNVGDDKWTFIKKKI